MDSSILTKIINNWIGSARYKMMVDGERYYLTNNDIKTRKFFYWSRKEKHPDIYRSNVKIANNFFKTILDQKISYCLGKDVVVKNFNPSFDINEEIYYVAEAASQKSIGWLFIYVDIDGVLKQKTIPSETIIEITDGTIEDNVTEIIRIYDLGDDKFCEVWDNLSKTTYQLKDGLYQEISTETHLNNNISWGVIPFIKLENNRYGYSDLDPIKPLIDAYDLIISDFANNFIDFQEIILLVKNYAENVKTEEAAAEFMEFLKKNKVINVKDNGDVEILSKEVPFQARKEFLEILRKNIFLFAQAVDIDDLSGSNLTNVNIKSKFSMLDQKANKFLKECKKFVIGLLTFSNKYNEIQKQSKQISQITASDIIFNKSQLINESEKIHDCIDMVGTGVAAQETIVANNPIVDDPEKELVKIDKDELNDTNNNGGEPDDVIVKD